MRRYVWSERYPLLALLLSMAMVTYAQAQEVRIGYVDMKRVLDNAPQVVAGRALLDQEFRARNDAIQLDETRLGLMETELAQADMTSDNYRRLEREVLELRRNVNRRKEDLRDELSFRRTEEVQRLEEQINLAVQDIAERNGYDLIVSSPVVYASPDLDITDLILEHLQAEFQADQLELGNP
ncbi:MAG: OmpH family outer membrane protein [Xanthomonadales bacterium]|nr:OmpH family outer membrane protein [Xanthomonadales bacterium]